MKTQNSNKQQCYRAIQPRQSFPDLSLFQPFEPPPAAHPYPDTSTKQQSIAGWTTSQLFVVSIPTKRFFFCSSYLLPSLMPFPYLHFSSHAMYRWPDKAHESDSLFYDEIHLVLSILPPTDFLPLLSFLHRNEATAPLCCYMYYLYLSFLRAHLLLRQTPKKDS